MSNQWITEEQTPHLHLSTEVDKVMYSGQSDSKDRSRTFLAIWEYARFGWGFSNLRKRGIRLP
jgi:hypothetical protein